MTSLSDRPPAGNPAHNTSVAVRLRWKLWALVSRSRKVCPANAYGRIIDRQPDRGIRVDAMCRRDLARTGSCWCGKLRLGTHPVVSGGW